MRVLVGRPLERGEATARRLAGLGHEAVLTPLFDVQPLPFDQTGLECDALILTSAQAVPAAALLRETIAHRPVFAVGSRTAEALRETGYGHVECAEGGDALALARLIGQRMPPGACLLHLAGRDRTPEPEASLRAAGFEILIREVYAAEAVPSLPEAALACLSDGQGGAMLHYSPRAAAHFVALARQAGLGARLPAFRHLCLSRAVADALGPDLAASAEIALRPDEDALLSLVGEAQPSQPLPARCYEGTKAAAHSCSTAER